MPDNHNPDIDQHLYIRRGPLLIDVAGLDSGTLVALYPTGHPLFVLKTTDSLPLFAPLEDFAPALADALGAGGMTRSMHARAVSMPARAFSRPIGRAYT